MKTWRQRILESFIVIFLTASLIWGATQTINTLPVSDSTFLTTLQAFLKGENAARFQKKYSGYTLQGGIGATSGTLAHTISALTAFPGGYYVYKDAFSHTYTASTRTYVYADYDSARTITIAGATVTRATHIVFAEMVAGAAEPVTPSYTVRLMRVDTSGAAITAVEDLRSGGVVSTEAYGSFESAIANAPPASEIVLARSEALTAPRTVPAKMVYSALPNAILTSTSTNILTFTFGASVKYENRQLFSTQPGGVVFADPVVIYPEMFGPGFGGTEDDANAWQCALDAFPATGGILDHNGVSLIASTLIWPNNGTTNYPIWLRGHVGSSQTGTFNTVTGGGGGQIKYTGTGTAIDFRNGDGSNLDFSGAITGIRLSGPYTTGDATPDNETNPLTVGLNFYNAKSAKIENVSIIGFGTGIYIANDLYYAKLRDLTISTAKWGMKTYGKWNGTTLENSKISTCNVGGIYAEYYGDNLSLINCWIELCGRYAGNYSSPVTGYGLSAQFGQMVTIIGGSHYWESNGDSDGGDAHIRINGDGYYSTILNLYGQHFSYSSKRYIAYLKDATALNVQGCELLSYQGATAPAYVGYMFQFSGAPSDGTFRGNKLPKLDLDYDTVTKQIHIASQSVLSRLDIQDHLHPGITLDRSGDGANYTRVIPKGHVFLNDDPTKANSGGLVGWQATEPGSGSLVDLNGVEPGDVQPDALQDWSEGTITNGEFTMSVVAGDGAGAKEGLTVGRAIQIDTDGAVANGAFAAANFLDAAGVTTDWAIIREVATTGEPSSITLDRSLSSATVTGGLLRPNLAEKSYIGGRTWYKSVTSVPSSGTGEDNLMVATTLTAAMLKTDSKIDIEATGTVTGTAGNHTIKLYFGTTAFTLLSGTTTEGDWWFRGFILVTGAATQMMYGTFHNADGDTNYMGIAATEAISGAKALKFTGECANGADVVAQNFFAAVLN